jgi:hypothetical protein
MRVVGLSEPATRGGSARVDLHRGECRGRFDPRQDLREGMDSLTDKELRSSGNAPPPALAGAGSAPAPQAADRARPKPHQEIDDPGRGRRRADGGGRGHVLDGSGDAAPYAGTRRFQPAVTVQECAEEGE